MKTRNRRLQRKYKYRGKGAGFFGDLWNKLTRRSQAQPQAEMPRYLTRVIGRPKNTQTQTQTQTQTRKLTYPQTFTNRLFGRKRPIAVKIPANILPMAVQERPDLPPEDLIPGRERIFAFLYNKMVGPEHSIALTIPQYPKGEELYKRLYGVKLSKGQREELRQAVNAAVSRGLTAEQMAQEVFHTPLQQLNKELSKAEGARNDGTRDLLYAKRGSDLVPVARAESWCRYLERCLGPIRDSDRQSNYLKNYYNGPLPKPDMLERYQAKVPIQTLKSDESIFIATSKDNLKQFLESINAPVNINEARFTVVFPFIILEKGLYPNTGQSLRLLVQASSLLKKSFIQDAFKQKKVEDVEENLAAVLKKEVPQLWYQAEVDRVNIVPVSKLSENNRNNFIIVKDEFINTMTVDVLKNLKKNLVLRKALAAGAVIYADPKTLWVIRRDLAELWAKNLNGDTTNMTAYYIKLQNEVQRLAVGYLQATNFMNHYRMLLEEDNLNLTDVAKYEQARLVAFTSDLSEPEVAKEMIAPLEKGFNSPVWKTFLQLQSQVPHTEGQIIRSPFQLKELMRQFNPEFERVRNETLNIASAVPFTRKNDIEEAALSKNYYHISPLTSPSPSPNIQMGRVNLPPASGAFNEAARGIARGTVSSARILFNKPQTQRRLLTSLKPSTTTTGPRFYHTRKNRQRK